MKTMINFSNLRDDADRYNSARDLQGFYRQFGCDGLELMHMEEDTEYAVRVDAASVIRPDMVTGIHACCLSDWMEQERSFLLEHYRKDLDFAHSIGAEYVVFHVTQVSGAECLDYHMLHTDKEVIDASCDLINELLEGQPYTFYFLMENLWWPGLTFLDPVLTDRLLDGVKYERKGLMLDTGHFMNTNPQLRTSGDAVCYLHRMLDEHRKLIPMIKGVHLHQSLSGEYVREYMKNPLSPVPDQQEFSSQVYEHIFRIDQHRPFTDPGVKGLIERISPEYLTYEYITRNREEHYQYLCEGSRAVTGVNVPPRK